MCFICEQVAGILRAVLQLVKCILSDKRNEFDRMLCLDSQC
jgi:hypothetical protein